MSIAVMRGIDCHIMILSSLANDIAAPSPQRRTMSTAASWIGSDMRIPRKRRLTSGASARLPGVVELILKCQIAPMVNYLRADLDQLRLLRGQRPVLGSLGEIQCRLFATSRHPVARNRLLLYHQHRTFRSLRWTSACDPTRTFGRWDFSRSGASHTGVSRIRKMRLARYQPTFLAAVSMDSVPHGKPTIAQAQPHHGQPRRSALFK